MVGNKTDWTHKPTSDVAYSDTAEKCYNRVECILYNLFNDMGFHRYIGYMER